MPDLNRSLLSEGENADTLGGLTDVTITAPAQFESLVYDGTNWVNQNAPVVSLAQNAEANTLTVGTVVYLFGGTGSHASVKRADNTSDATSSKTVGMVAASIGASATGPIVTRGYVSGMDLSTGYTAGDVLWLGTNGQFTKTKTVAPNHLVFVGVVVRATVNGIIYVATQNGYELDEIHNVAISNTVANGDFLRYNGTVWVNDVIDLGTDTTGNYMSNVTAGNLITITHTPGEGSNATIALTSGTSGQIIVANATGVPTWVTESGDITVDASGVTSITSNVIVNADINSSAAIAHSKLANATAGQVLLGTTTTGVVTATTVSGDVTITGAGVTSITSNSIVNADVNSAAAIDLSKLASGSSAQIVLANATGVPTYTTVSGDITITNTGNAQIAANAISNADISTTAAIQLSKLASGSSAQVVLANATGVPTYVTLSGDVTIAANGLTTIAADSVALGTDTTGNYVGSVAAGTGITVSNTGVEGGTFTVTNAGVTSITGTANEITASASTGSVTLSLPANVTISNNLTVTGDLTVNGNTTTLNTANLNVEDNFILLNSGVTGSPSLNAGIEVKRGTSTNVAIRWNETTDKWEFTVDGTNYTELGAGGATVSSSAPSSPTTGSLWFDSDTAQTFVYYDSSWVEIGASSNGVTISDTAPSSPIVGQLWYKSDTGATYIYYDSYWVEVGGVSTNIVLNTIDAKGDLIVGTADNTISKLSAGTNGYVLAANSATATGLEWTQVSSNPMTSNAAAIFIMDIGA